MSVWSTLTPIHRLVVMLGLVLSLSACKESLHSNLSEREANEILVSLAQAGIEGTKSNASDKTFSVDVEGAQLAAAIEVLSKAGLPRKRFVTLGDLFGDAKIVSTPTEERIRFQFGVSQELSETVSTIDGVTAARVHLVVPKSDPLSDKAKPSSASVFIKHRADLDLTPLIPSIKSLVLRSVEGLTHDTVYVSLFPAEPVPASQLTNTQQPLLGIALDRANATWINGLIIAMLALLLASLAYFIFRYRALVENQTRALRQARRQSAPLPDLGPATTPITATNSTVPAAR